MYGCITEKCIKALKRQIYWTILVCKCKETTMLAERYVRTLKNKVFEHVSVFSRNVNFDKQLILLTNSCKNIVYGTKKIKPKSIFLIVILNIFIVKTERN